MGKLQYTNVASEHNARGMDTYSPNSKIPPGYAELLENVDTNASGQLETRKGYQSHAGWLPLRARTVSHSGTDITFEVDTSTSIDLTAVGNGPILAYGKILDSVGGTGDWTATNALRYYPSFTVDNRETLSLGSNTITKSSSAHGLTTKYIAAGFAESTSNTNTSNELQTPDAIRINDTSYEVQVDYTTAVATTGYVWFKDISAVAGTRYIESVSAVTSKTITAATHALTNFNILAYCFDTTVANTLTQVVPDDITVDTSGEVVLTFNTAFTGDIVLVAAPIANVLAQSVAAAGSHSFTLSSPDTPYIYLQGYYFDAGTSKWTGITPDSVTYSATADEFTINYTLASGTENVEFYYEFGQVASNKIKVTDTTATSETYSTSAPQITLWGIGHEGIYLSTTRRGGHVNHIDSYRRVGEERVVAGLGGNIFAARLKSEIGTTYGLEEYDISLRTRADGGDRYLAPLFDTSGSSVTRTRGLVTDASISNNRAKVTAATYISSGVVDYTLTFTSKTGNVVLGTEVSTEDYLTVSGMAHSQHNGTWLVQSVTSDSATQTVIRVANSNIINDRFDETGAAGRAGVFTDKIELTAGTHPFIPSDKILSTAIDSDLTVLFSSTNPSATNEIFVSGVTEEITIPDGVQITAQRTTNVIPVSNTDNLVRGDMCSVSSLSRKVRVLEVNTNADNSVTVTANGTTATVTCSAAHLLDAGKRVLLNGFAEDSLNGVHTVASVTSSTVFTFSTTVTTGSVSGTLVGETFTIDESLQVSDGSTRTKFTVANRWIPVEAPTPSGQLPKLTYQRHLDTSDYDNHPILRSTIINDSMFFTNQQDEVYKFDGTNLFRAGLPRWQPGLFAQVDGDTASILKGFTVAYSASSASERSFTLASPVFSAGDRVYDDTTTSVFTVVRTEVVPGSPDTYKIFVSGDDVASITGTGNLTLAKIYRYYFRLNYIDANNNVVTSNIAQSSDFFVEQYIDGQIRLRLTGLPDFDNYDYDYIEVETYRTVSNTNNPFFLVNRTVLPFNRHDGYVDIIDTTDDSLLQELDPVTSSLLGQELGVGWSQPLRAKYLTTAANSLVLANIKDYPKIDLVLAKRAGVASVATSDLDNYKVLIRKDNTDTSTTTNMTDRVRYEFLSDGDQGLSPTLITFDFVDGDVNTGQDTIAETAHGLRTGQAVQLTTTGTLPSPLATSTTYYVIRVTANSIKLATSLDNANAGTAIDITSAAGGGTHTVTVVNYMTTSFDFATTDVSLANDTITETDHNLSTGDKVQFSTSGTLPTGLSAATDYYVIRVDADTIKVATSFANAEDGVAVDINTSTGSGTHTCEFQNTVEINKVSHGLSAGDWLYLFHGEENTTNKLTFAGWYQIAQADSADSFSIHTNHNGIALREDDVDRFVTATSTVDVPVWLGTDGNRNQRGGNPSGSAQIRAAERLAAAINATMRVTDRSTNSTFVPWISAFAGNSYESGQVLLEQPVALDSTPEVVLDSVAATSNYTWFGNDIQRTGGESDAVVAYTNVFPSRVTISYPNFPEIFNRPDTLDANITSRVVDVDAANGQAITSCINFFGESAFGDANLSEIVLVFKEQSVYALNARTGDYQRLETSGQGCTAPFSVAPTKDGVFFANESGIYRINRDLSMSWVGKNMDGYWKDSVNKTQLAEATGHQYKFGRKYKLSVPVNSDLYNSKVIVYNQDQEGEGQQHGGWTTYTNHTVTGWTNLSDDAYWASQAGDVFVLRTNEEAQDYRDDDAAVAEQVIRLRAENFGVSGVRKVVSSIITDLELPLTDVDALTIKSRIRRTGDFTTAATVNIDRDDYESVTFRSSPQDRRGNFFQVEYRHSTKDQALVLTGVTYRVGLATDKGILEAADLT